MNKLQLRLNGVYGLMRSSLVGIKIFGKFIWTNIFLINNY